MKNKKKRLKNSKREWPGRLEAPSELIVLSYFLPPAKQVMKNKIGK